MNSQIQIQGAEPIPLKTDAWTPYPPSFMDRFMDAVKRLPIPYALTYLTLFILWGIANHVASWADGWLPLYSFSSMSLLFPLWFCAPLAIVTYLDNVARKALNDFRPLLDVPEETMRRLEYEFLTMPPKGVLWSSALFLFLYLGSMALASRTILEDLGLEMPAAIFLFLQGLITWTMGSVIYYHTVRQLRLVDKTVKLVKHFNLFRLEPVYAFSAVTSRTAIAWAILIGLTWLIFPLQVAPVPMLTLLIVQILLVLAAFVLPLRIVNQQLVTEKRKLLAEHNLRVEATLARLHRAVDENQTGYLEQITGLNAEREILERIQTWPWPPRVFTGFLTIVVLPIVLFAIQLAVERWLTP